MMLCCRCVAFVVDNVDDVGDDDDDDDEAVALPSSSIYPAINVDNKDNDYTVKDL